MKNRMKSPSMSLFDQLGAGLDVIGQVPVPKYHRYQHEDADQGEIAPAQVPANPLQSLPQNMTDIKFTHSLIKHLDSLYGKMLAGEVKQLASEPEYNPKQKIIEGQTDQILLNEKESYYNPGNSNVTESF